MVQSSAADLRRWTLDQEPFPDLEPRSYFEILIFALRFPAFIFCVLLTVARLFAQPADVINFDSLLPGSAGEPVSETCPVVFPARGGDVDWGLALSGGGLRSAAFSIGAMKALYDLGLLDDIDVISSVSGGSYASYWLYSRFDPDNDIAFGDAAFSGELFTRNVCTLGSKSEFFPFRRMIASAFSSRDRAFRKYRDSIEWSFGANHWKSRKEIRLAGEPGMRPLRYLLPEITAARVPYFIINTTIKNKRGRAGEKLSEVAKTFEIGPTYRGSTAFGFSKWGSEKTGIATWCNATAISGAGIRSKLSRKIDDYAEPPTNKRIDLADGGLSENLAALPLIRRGIKNIVIVDAENDPGYKFVSYCKLREHLKSLDIGLAIGAIDDFFDCDKKKHRTRDRIFTAPAVARGTATSADHVSNIYYIKMSRPDSIFKSVSRSNEPGKHDETRPTSCSGPLEQIGYETLRRDMLAYSAYLNKDWRWGKFFEFLPWINYNFPQITTIDQTFYSDQLKAFIGLGYLETCEMEQATGTGKSCLPKSVMP